MTFTVMVVDDDPHLRVLLRQMLAYRGFEVIEAEDGYDALDRVRSVHVDLIILDVMMPELDGVSTCAAIRRNKKLKDLPIIMLSGKVHNEAVQEGLAAGANRYLFKPIPMKTLIAEIKACLPIRVS